jgi:hypothetical protein
LIGNNVPQITIPDDDPDYIIFNSKEEYDAHAYSPAGYARYMAKPWNIRGCSYKFYDDPHHFPCLAVIRGTIPNSDGADWKNVMYFYDFKE